MQNYDRGQKSHIPESTLCLKNQNKPKLLNGNESAFVRHLEKCSEAVAKWPEWKRNILGKSEY